MTNIFFNSITEFINLICNKAILGLSLVFGIILSAIGYPKQVLAFILFLTIIDTLTKHYSIVRINYGKFTLQTYCKAWKERKLTSRGLKNGLGIKTILYLPVLFVAHQVNILDEIMFGHEISNSLYSLLAIIEFRSILENFEDCGVRVLSGILKFIKVKEKSLSEGDTIAPEQSEDEKDEFGDGI